MTAAVKKRRSDGHRPFDQGIFAGGVAALFDQAKLLRIADGVQAQAFGITLDGFDGGVGMRQDDLATGSQNDPLLVTHTPLEAQCLGAGQLGNAQAHSALRHKQGHGFLCGGPHALHDGLAQGRYI